MVFGLIEEEGNSNLNISHMSEAAKFGKESWEPRLRKTQAVGKPSYMP